MQNSTLSSSQLFSILAQGQQPRSLGRLNSPLEFSRNARTGDFTDDYARLPVKLGGSPLILPEHFKQFEEFAVRALTDYMAKSSQNDYMNSKATFYFSQRRLDPGQVSLVEGAHLDIDLKAAMLGNSREIEIYIASDVSAVTTRIYTNPIEIDETRFRSMPSDILQEQFSQELERQCLRNGSIDPQAYEIVNFAQSQPHAARSLHDKAIDRTFVAIMISQDTRSDYSIHELPGLEDLNEDLFAWYIGEDMRRALERHLVF